LKKIAFLGTIWTPVNDFLLPPNQARKGLAPLLVSRLIVQGVPINMGIQ